MDQVRRVESLLTVPLPQDLCGQASAFRQGHKTLDGIADDGFSVIHCAKNVVDEAVVSVMTVYQTNMTLIPDHVRAANNVVDNVGVTVIATLHRVRARLVGGYKVDEIVPFDLQDFAGGGVFLVANVPIRVFQDVAIVREECAHYDVKCLRRREVKLRVLTSRCARKHRSSSSTFVIRFQYMSLSSGGRVRPQVVSPARSLKFYVPL